MTGFWFRYCGAPIMAGCAGMRLLVRIAGLLALATGLGMAAAFLSDTIISPRHNVAAAATSILIGASDAVGAVVIDSIFNPANLAGLRWVDGTDLAKQFAAQLQTAIWHTLPSTIRCGRNSRLVSLTSSDGSRFLTYAFFKYPEGTVGVGSDMIYVVLRARVSHGRHSGRHAICAVNGTDNKWFNIEPTHKDCVLTP
jgi:hypothetical protein